jgi:adenosylcobyric acid synthase
VLGGGVPENRVWGTYLHGLFESDAYRHQFLDGLRQRRGLLPLRETRHRYSLEATFDRLADRFREQVDYAAILRLLGLP